MQMFLTVGTWRLLRLLDQKDAITHIYFLALSANVIFNTEIPESFFPPARCFSEISNCNNLIKINDQMSTKLVVNGEY